MQHFYDDRISAVTTTNIYNIQYSILFIQLSSRIRCQLLVVSIFPTICFKLQSEVKFSRNAIPAPLAGVPPPPIGVPAEFNHWDQLNINTGV